MNISRMIERTAGLLMTAEVTWAAFAGTFREGRLFLEIKKRELVIHSIPKPGGSLSFYKDCYPSQAEVSFFRCAVRYT